MSLMIDNPQNSASDQITTSSFVITAHGGNEIFRFQQCVFSQKDCAKHFVFPVPKFLVVTEGQADWQMGKRIYNIKKGDIAILRSGLLRRFDSFPENSVLICDIYEFVPSFLDNFECYELFRMDTTEENAIFKYREGVSDRLLDAFEILKKEVSTGDPCCSDIVRSILANISVSIIRDLGLKIGQNKSKPWEKITYKEPSLPFEYPTTEFFFTDVPGAQSHSAAISEVLEVIYNNISHEIDIDALATEAHMSRSYFYKIFRKYTGMSINDFILKCRVDNTIRLVLETGCSILKAAYESGFTSSSGFYKTFKNVTGKSPKEYIRNALAKRNPGYNINIDNLFPDEDEF